MGIRLGRLQHRVRSLMSCSGLNIAMLRTIRYSIYCKRVSVAVPVFK
jgi:hypothetical protein